MPHYNVDSFRQREALKAGRGIEIRAERLSAEKRKQLRLAQMRAGRARKKQIKSDLSLLRLKSEVRRAQGAREE